MAETKKFLNHDDKISSSSLHVSFTFTAQAYEKKYAQPYSECSCWYCECVREPLRSNFLSKLSSRNSPLSITSLEAKGFTNDTALGPHVSAHNAYAVSDSKTAAQRRRELEALDVQYAKVCKRYKKQKRSEPPKRDPNSNPQDAYAYGSYGYPVPQPTYAYIPYEADSTACEWAVFGSEDPGSCAAGTCCNGASMGSCAGGYGTPGCAASCGGQGGADGGCGTCGGGDGGGCGGG